MIVAGRPFVRHTRAGRTHGKHEHTDASARERQHCRRARVCEALPGAGCLQPGSMQHVKRFLQPGISVVEHVVVGKSAVIQVSRGQTLDVFLGCIR